MRNRKKKRTKNTHTNTQTHKKKQSQTKFEHLIAEYLCQMFHYEFVCMMFLLFAGRLSAQAVGLTVRIGNPPPYR